MNARNKLELLTRSALWAIKPEALLALTRHLIGMDAETVLINGKVEAVRPSIIGKKDNRVSVLPVTGVLTKDDNWFGTTYNDIAAAAEQAASDASIKRLVLAVDSPGGEVVGLPETAAVLAQVAKVKPVSAIVEGTSASAAYWLTSQAHDITIAPSAELGSVGVRMMHVDISKSLGDAGVKVTELHSGEFKTEWSPFQPLSEAAQEDMQKRLDSVHRDFLTAVGTGRGTRARAQIRANRFGEGRMFSAAEAVARGMADAVLAPREFYRAITPGQEPTNYGLQRARLEFERNRF